MNVEVFTHGINSGYSFSAKIEYSNSYIFVCLCNFCAVVQLEFHLDIYCKFRCRYFCQLDTYYFIIRRIQSQRCLELLYHAYIQSRNDSKPMEHDGKLVLFSEVYQVKCPISICLMSLYATNCNLGCY